MIVITLPTMSAFVNIGIDFTNTIRNSSDNYDKVRDHMSTPNKQSSREFSISSTISSVTYHDRVMTNNDKDSDTIIELIDIFQLSYMTIEKQTN